MANNLSFARHYHNKCVSRHLAPDALYELNVQFVENVNESYHSWAGEGLGDWTSHRPDLDLGTRTVCAPITVPAPLFEMIEVASRLLIAELHAESDEQTIERVQAAQLGGIRLEGVDTSFLRHPCLYSAETIRAVKAKIIASGRLGKLVDFVPVPVEIVNGEPVPIALDPQFNNAKSIRKLVHEKELQFAFLCMEGTFSVTSYYGFAYAYLANGRLDSLSLKRFRRDVQNSLYGAATTRRLVDYKIIEKDGERHHALGDKLLISELWGKGEDLLDIRALAKLNWGKSNTLDGLHSQVTPREMGHILLEFNEVEIRNLYSLLNQPERWIVHPVEIMLADKSFLTKVFASYGPKSLMIPSFERVEQVTNAPTGYVISKPVSGDSGYGIFADTAAIVTEQIAAESHEGVAVKRINQPLVDLLRMVPNSMEFGALAGGSTIELRVASTPTVGLTRSGAFQRPAGSLIMTEQEYIMGDILRLVEQFQQVGQSQPEAWYSALLTANVGFGVFQVG